MKFVKWIVTIVLLAGATVICFFRWQAWFGMPAEPVYRGDTLACHFVGFGRDSVPGFIQTEAGWQDTLQPDVLRLLLLGDVHNMLDSADYACICHRHDTIDAVAQLGDWMERGYFYYAQQLLHQTLGTGLDSLPVMACPGNHEYTKGVRKSLPALWHQLFLNPLNGPQRFMGSTYYVDFPRVRFIVLDTQGQQLLSDYTITLTWLKKVMQEAKGRFIIVMMHHPVYSSGEGRFNLATWLTFQGILQRADVVVAGHDHGYAVRGHFINTNSSRKVYQSKNAATTDTVANSRLYEVVEIKADTLRVSTYSLDSLDDIQTLQFAPLVQDSAAVAEHTAKPWQKFFRKTR